LALCMGFLLAVTRKRRRSADRAASAKDAAAIGGAEPSPAL